MFKGTNLQPIGKSWKYNTQNSDKRQQYCFINFKIAKKLVDLNCSYFKNEIIM